AAIGAATEAAVRAFGGEGIFVSSRSDAAGLAELLPIGSGARVLVPASSLAGPELRERLAARGAAVDVITAYRTVPDQGGIAALDQRLARAGLDALLVTSGSTIRFLMGELSPHGRTALTKSAARPAIVSIGPATTAVAREHGLAVAATATSPTHDGMLDAIRSCFDHAA
ncbi:MAG TPA: uroporphyrinogen-III synthase, partial [Gemmatimonadales bacterium]|nr:uroporphyrinogen-III synthase [Gemmatimonadales bacterium]